MKANSDLLYISISSVRTEDTIEAVQKLSVLSNNIELSGGTIYDENLLERLILLKQQKRINFLVHSYFPPPKERFILNFADTSGKTREFIREAMRLVDLLDACYYSVHAGFKKEFVSSNNLLSELGSGKVFRAGGIEDNLKWFRKEFPNKKIALENLYPNNHNTECCFMIHIDEIVLLLEKFPDIYFLLDLGHLKVSSQLLDFDYLNSVELLFERYSNRILEIHLSENNSTEDDHFILYPDSIQYKIVKDYASMIKENRINITIESRNSTIQELSDCFMRVNNIISTTQ